MPRLLVALVLATWALKPLNGRRVPADTTQAFSAHAESIEIHVEGNKIKVPGSVLALASPVFEAMLGTDMHERREHYIKLPGKLKADFDLFWDFIRPVSRLRVDYSNVDRMLPWFDEYQVDGLKNESEAVLLTLPVTVERLSQAYTFSLPRQFPRCSASISVEQFLIGIDSLASSPALLRELLPGLKRRQESTGIHRASLSFIEARLQSKRPLTPLVPILQLSAKYAAVVSDDMLASYARLPHSTPEDVKLTSGVFESECRRRMLIYKLFHRTKTRSEFERAFRA